MEETASQPAQSSLWRSRRSAPARGVFESCDALGSQLVFCGSRIQPLVAARVQEVRPVRIGQAVEAGWNRADERFAINPGQNPVAGLHNVSHELLLVPT